MKIFISIIFLLFSTQIVAEGLVIHEAMYSGIYDLSTNDEELMLRIHPEKKKLYDAILSGNVTVPKGRQRVQVTGLEIRVNSKVGLVEKSYASIVKTEVTGIDKVLGVNGFDAEGEPLIYTMNDGTIRVVFFNMPPFSSKNGSKMDLDKFSKEFIATVRSGVSHDDREIFHVPNPDKNTEYKIKQFIEAYNRF